MPAGDSAFDEFVQWLGTRPGNPPTAGSWTSFAAEVMRRRDGIEDALLTPVTIEDPGESIDFERWSPNRRLRWNLNALHVLAAVRRGEVLDPGLVRRALRAYTGWGGFTRVLSDLPTTPGLFDAETTAAIVEWKSAFRTGRRPSTAILSLNEALRTQYFTPIGVCGAMWTYAGRLVEGAITRVLEPSAGVGRMIDALPFAQLGEVEVHAVEYDATLAGLLAARLTRPQDRVHAGPFESWNVSAGTYDVVISNPPYMERAPGLRRTAEPTVTRAEHYSMIRSLELLRAGGVLVSLTPASLVQGTAPDNVSFRARMHRHADFRGAVLLPASCFPGVPNLLTVQVWSKRATPRSVADAAQLAEQPYEFPPSNILGQLVDAYRGQKVEGTFDPLAADRVVWLTRDGTGTVEGPQEVPDAFVAPAAPSVPPESGKRPVRPARPQREALPEAIHPDDQFRRMSVESLGARLAGYYHRLDQGMLTLVEVGRQELLIDLAWHTGLWGVPSAQQLLGLPAGSQGGWARYGRDGISPTPVVQLEEAPSPGATPFQTVAHFCRTNGFCSEEQLDRFFPGIALLDDLVQQGVLLAPDPRGGFYYFTEEHYLTGDLSARLAATSQYLIDSAEQLAAHPQVAERLKAGVARLEALIGSTSVLNLGISARSALVPQDMRSAWVKAVVHPEAILNYDGAFYEIRIRRANGKHVSLDRFLDVGFEDMDGHKRGSQKKKLAKDERELMVDRAVGILGYLNRQTQVEIGGEGKRNVFKAGMAFSARAAAESEVEDSFNRWVTQPEQVAYAQQLEAIYNDRIHRQGGRLYSTDPVPLARQNQNIPLRAHQNQTIRWQMDRVGGFLFDAVGAGKTFSILGSIVLARQTGRARRWILSVPVSTLAQWYAQARLFLPDYRIGLVGLQPFTDKHGRKTVREEDQASRAVKWDAFRRGFFDILIVGHQGFLNDVYPSSDTIAETMADQSWLQRGLAKKAAARLKAERELASYRRALANSPNIDPSDPKIVAHIEALETTIRENTPKDREIQDAVAEGDLPPDGYRPDKAANLIAWEDLAGPDVAIAVDEAHIFKNLWAPTPRLGATIAFLGATEKGSTKKKDGSGDEEMQLTKMSWDLLFKCTYLSNQRGDGQGVFLATATPYSSSPIELYNLGCYLSPRFWPDNGIEHKEEFIEAFLDIQEVNTASVMTLEGHVGPGVRGFKKPGPLARLHSILAPVMQRRTKEDLTVAGIIELPTVYREDIVVPMTGAQARANDAIRAVAEERIMRKIRKKEKSTTAEDELWTFGKENALTLALMSLLSDVALDPRLLVLDFYRTRSIPWSLRTFKGRYTSERRTAFLNSYRKKHPDAHEQLAENAWDDYVFADEGELSEDLGFVYDHIWEMMAAHGVHMPGDLEISEEPEKFIAIADRMLADWQRQEEAGRKRAGVLVFLDSVESHEWFIQALVDRGIERERIAVIAGSVTKPKRDQIALDYNGRSAVYDPITKELIEDSHEYRYDVLIGNSKAMATGLNLQRRTGAIYHVTFTWTPDVIEQREGRGVRQGNTEGDISVYNVVAEKSFDGILVNTSQGKAEWQNEVFPGIAPVTSAASGMDREEALIRWVVRDPEAAQKLFLEIRERQKRENETRMRLHAWRIWSSAYANVRQIVQGSPRADQILAGVRYTLENSPRTALACLPQPVIDKLMVGEAAYPDVQRKRGFFYGGNRMAYADGHTEDVRVLQAYVTDRMITLYHRKRGEILVEQTRIYRPGSSGNRADDAVIEAWEPFPGVVSTEPIPWNRRAEAKSMADFDLAQVYRALLSWDSTRYDKILAQRLWESIPDRSDLFGWGTTVQPYGTPDFPRRFTQMVTDLGLHAQPQGKNEYNPCKIRVVVVLESGTLAIVDPIAYGTPEYSSGGTALKIRRMLTPGDSADRVLLEQAIRANRVRRVSWTGREIGSAMDHPNDWMRKEEVASLLWTLYYGWGGRLTNELIQDVLAIPGMSKSVTVESLTDTLGTGPMPYVPMKRGSAAQGVLPVAVERDGVSP